jgi:hypothetical protein
VSQKLVKSLPFTVSGEKIIKWSFCSNENGGTGKTLLKMLLKVVPSKEIGGRFEQFIEKRTFL